MSNFIVTGAAGFIGSALAAELIKNGHTVVTIDNLSTGYETNIPDGVEFILGDCGDKEAVKKIPERNYDAIFHIAGQSSGEISFDDPVKDLSSNTESTLLLLDYCRSNNCKRFIYASSMSVYGTNDQEGLKENDKCSPKSFYAVGKLASEHYLKIYKKFGINSTSLRLFNTYGPGQNMTNLKQGMLSIYLAQFLKEEKVIVKGSGDRYRDLIYIDDVIEAITRTVNTKDSFNEIINIGTGNKVTVDDILEAITIELKTDKEILYMDGTPGDLHGVTACTGKMNKILGTWPKTELKQGLEKMINSLS